MHTLRVTQEQSEVEKSMLAQAFWRAGNYEEAVQTISKMQQFFIDRTTDRHKTIHDLMKANSARLKYYLRKNKPDSIISQPFHERAMADLPAGVIITHHRVASPHRPRSLRVVSPNQRVLGRH